MKVQAQLVEDWSMTGVLRQVVRLDHACMEQPWSEDQWAGISPENYRLYVTQQDGLCVGFALFLLSPQERLAHLLKMVMGPQWRGTEMSSGFWRQVCADLRVAKTERVFLEVAESNHRARGFYRKVGFRELRRVKGFYHNGEAAFTMELAI